MVGKEYEQGGIIKHGAMMINAVSNSTVPHLSVIMGASYGAGNYGMNGRAYDPRFLFTWPSAKSAVMGPAQLAGVLEIVAQQSAEAKGEAFDKEGFDGDQGGRRGTGRGAVAAVLPLRDALRRRGDRPPRHPHHPRHLPVRDREQGLSRAPTGSGCSAHDAADPPHPGRQPGRDRQPGVPHLPEARHRDRRRALRRRRRPALRARGRRRRTAARRRARRHLPARRPAGRRRAAGRRRRDPPGLRVPVGERRVRPHRHRRQAHLDRAAARVDRHDGLEDRGQAS